MAIVTLAPVLRKEDGMIDFTRSAREIVARLRGFQPWPGAYTLFRGKGMKLLAARAEARAEAGAMGSLTVRSDGLYVSCGDGTALEIVELQPEGKKRMSATDFIHGYHPTAGEVLGR